MTELATALEPLLAELAERVAPRVAELLDDRRDQGFLNVDGAGAYLGLSRKAVYALVERGRVPHYRAGRRLLFDRVELRAWLERG